MEVYERYPASIFKAEGLGQCRHYNDYADNAVGCNKDSQSQPYTSQFIL